MKEQKKIGIAISYVNIVLSVISNIVIVPLLINYLTDDNYSVYKIMQSFAGPLIMFNMGLSTVAARTIVKFRANENKDIKEKQNSLALVMMITMIMATIVVIIGVIMSGTIDNIFGSKLSEAQLGVSKKIFMLFVSSTAVHIIKDMLRGCVQGNEKFIFYYGSETVHHLLRFALLVGMIMLGFDVVAITSIDLIIGLIIVIGYLCYIKFSLHEKFKFYYFDKAQFLVILSFSFSVLLQAIINQVNNNLDVVVLGATVNNDAIITMYSSALQIFTTYNSLLSVLVIVQLPKAVYLVTQEKSGEELTDFVIKSGRMQSLFAIIILGGFTICGRDFISLWIGPQYINAYYVILMLTIPTTIPLVQNVCLSILDAKLKRLFRSVTLAIIAVINLIISVILVNYISFWGVAIGTVISIILGHCIIMNIYYQKVIKLNVIRMFKGMFKGFLPAGILAVICSIPLFFIPTSLIAFIFKGIVFVLIFGVWLWIIGLNKSEKEYAKSCFQKVKQRILRGK